LREEIAHTLSDPAMAGGSEKIPIL
jgi:hypothetical protein